MILSLIAEALVNGEDVNLTGIGVIAAEAHDGRNIVTFKPCKGLREAVNKYPVTDLSLVAALKQVCFNVIKNHPNIKCADWIGIVEHEHPELLAATGITARQLSEWWSVETYRDPIRSWCNTFAEWSAAMPSYLEFITKTT